jgi:hypothetical protein
MSNSALDSISSSSPWWTAEEAITIGAQAAERAMEDISEALAALA